MIRIIVVDDEPFGADSLSDALREELPGQYECDVRTAYNARSALALFDQEPCDILLSDISMPGMSGLELAREIHGRDASVRVIFLTGFDDFSFAYEAFHQNAAHYLLKTEGDEVILRTVQEEIQRVLERRQILERIQDAEERYRQMLPSYRRQLLLNTLADVDVIDADEEIQKILGEHMYLMVARYVDDQEAVIRERLIVASAITQIFEGALAEKLMWTESFPMGNRIVWVFSMADAEEYTQVLFLLARKARHFLEANRGQKLFFVVSEESVGLDGIQPKYAEIQNMFSLNILTDAEGVAVRHGEAPEVRISSESVMRMNALRKQVRLCAQDLREGDVAHLKEHSEPVIQYIETHPSRSDLFVRELTLSVNALLLEYINEKSAYHLLEKFKGPDGIQNPRGLIERLSQSSEGRKKTAVQSIAQYLIEYIHKHLGEEISTSVLAEKTGYSSGYLLRVFRQQEKISIQEYITQERIRLAEQLLRNTNLRVYEIARTCGYENTTYFIRVFKNATGRTPQEYKQN